MVEDDLAKKPTDARKAFEKALVDAKQSLDAEAAVWRLAYKRSLFMAK